MKEQVHSDNAANTSNESRSLQLLEKAPKFPVFYFKKLVQRQFSMTLHFELKVGIEYNILRELSRDSVKDSL
ncbi:hypothetical protein BGX26_001161 [Mortierella sp. AD094]|nr:hypothetical protein BGX26_001161 [Mortierella sp. AD094]